MNIWKEIRNVKYGRSNLGLCIYAAIKTKTKNLEFHNELRQTALKVFKSYAKEKPGLV